MTRSDADRDKLVSELMLDAGLPGDAPLKAALDSLASLAGVPAPAPRGELAALLGMPAVDHDGGTDLDGGRDLDGGTEPEADELAKRRRRKHRPIVIAGAVMTAMGLGIGGVAASGGLPQNPPEFFNQLIAGWAPRANPAPQSLLPAGPSPDEPKVTSVPAPSSPPPPESAAGSSQGRASTSPSTVPNHVRDAASKGKSSATAAGKKAAKAKPNQAAGTGRGTRPAGSAGSAPGGPAGPSGLNFKDSFEAVLDEPGIVDGSTVDGSTVDDVLDRIVRLGTRL